MNKQQTLDTLMVAAAAVTMIVFSFLVTQSWIQWLLVIIVAVIAVSITVAPTVRKHVKLGK